MKRDGRSNRAAAVQNAGRAACPHAAATPWPKVRLGEIAECTLGKMLDHKKNHGIPQPYLANFNVRWGEFDLTDVSMMPMEPEEFEKYELKRGDLVVCEGGEIGRCALWKEQVSGMKIQKALHRVRVKDGVDSTYLYYWFLNSGRSDFFKQFTTGATILHLPRQNLLEIPIPLPPLPIQRRIASVLGAYDDLIENNRRRIALLEKMARELYRERFVRRSGKGNTVRIIDICTRIGSGGTPNRKSSEYWGKGAIRWFKTKELCDGWLIDSEESISEDGLKNSAAKLFPPHSILMAIYAAPTVGRLGVLSQTATSNQAALALVVDESKVSWQWLFQKLYEHRDHFNKIAAGAGQQNISGEIVKQHEVKLPSKVEIDDYTCRVSQMWDEMLNLALQNRSLTRQRDRLLPRLMSGKIDVEALVKEEERHG